jgi:uncharacterized protein YjdB
VLLAGAACTGADSISSNESGLPETVSVSITPRLDTVEVGATSQLVARVTTDRGEPRNRPVEWRSANPAVASVSSVRHRRRDFAWQYPDQSRRPTGSRNSATIVVTRRRRRSRSHRIR